MLHWTEDTSSAAGATSWPLLLSSLQAVFQTVAPSPTSNADLNERIASSVMACFPGDLFDANGMFQSLWLLRLQQASGDDQDKLEAQWSSETRRRVEAEWFGRPGQC